MNTDRGPGPDNAARGCVAVIGVLFGLALQVPSLWVLSMAASEWKEGRSIGDAGGVIVICLLVSAVGVFFIAAIFRGSRR